MKNKNFKRFLPAIGILAAIVVVITVIATSSKNSEENKSDSGMNTGNIENGTSSSAGDNNNTSAEPVTGNPLDVPQVNTSSTNEYIDDSGSAMAQETVGSIQEQIIAKFKTIPQERLNLKNVDLDSARIMFGEGVMKIANKECLGFTVYVLNGNYLQSAGMYAMSIDTEVLYRYDTDTMTYIFVNMN